MATRTHKDRVTAAFKELRKLGYTSRQSFTCCNSCGSYELAEIIKARGDDPDTAKVVWYNRQAAEAFDRRTGGLTRNLMLAWNGDAAEIRRALEAEGLRVIHNGDGARCIEVACFDDFTHRAARSVVRDLQTQGHLPEGQNPDLDDLANDVAEQLAEAGVTDPTARRVA
jgi:hypothetical protein